MAEEVNLVFDPNQDLRQKRALRQSYRELTKKVEAQHADPNNCPAADLLANVTTADTLFGQVKDPQEAVLDSRLLLIASNVAAAKARAMKSGSGSFDVDEFISKLVGFMGHQQVNRENFNNQDDDDDASAPLDWAKIGRKALAKSRRAPAISFMLGPLSIEQKKRANVKRAKHEKNTAEETKPQELKEEDIQRSENETVQNVAQLAKLLDGKDQVNLFKFVVNPKDFAQTVENIFYLSFLIRDGKVALETNEEGEPMIFECSPPTDEDYKQGLTKQQLVLEFDMTVWKRAIKVFNITEPMIPARPPAKTKLGSWYG